ncbi:MAG: hypothetical protein ACJAZ1_003514 [Yoonia sp.]|jgi:hypothetical protein
MWKWERAAPFGAAFFVDLQIAKNIALRVIYAASALEYAQFICFYCFAECTFLQNN